MPLYEITVNLEPTGHASSVVFLDGSAYRFEFYTNRWDNGIYFDLYDNQNTPLVIGIGLVAGVDMLYPYRSLPVPPGQLFVYSQGNTDENNVNGALGVVTLIDPSLNAFSKDVATLYYLSVT